MAETGGAVGGGTLMTLREVAAELRAHPATVRRRRAMGLIPPPVRVGGSIRWLRAELLDWLEARCPPMNRWQWPPPSERRRVRRGPARE